MLPRVLLVLIAGVLSACLPIKSDDSRRDTHGLRNIIPTAERDRPPQKFVDLSHVPNAEPRIEVRTAAGNKSPYMVKGVIYRVMDNPAGFSEEGISSWYGEKFHGNRTSNGEVYDMYAMTAAHKTLPVPCYVRVTRLDTKRSIIVRVNDRGPFASGRVIDLSYAGAQKLGFLKAGTARVRVEYIDPVQYLAQKASNPTILSKAVDPISISVNQVSAPVVPVVGMSSGIVNKNEQAKSEVSGSRASHEVPQFFLQVGAYSSKEAAETAKFQISSISQYDLDVEPGVDAAGVAVFRVYMGPFPDDATLQVVKRVLMEQGLAEPLRFLK